jgi:hypothetical protein
MPYHKSVYWIIPYATVVDNFRALVDLLDAGEYHFCIWFLMPPDIRNPDQFLEFQSLAWAPLAYRFPTIEEDQIWNVCPAGTVFIYPGLTLQKEVEKRINQLGFLCSSAPDFQTALTQALQL